MVRLALSMAERLQFLAEYERSDNMPLECGLEYANILPRLWDLGEPIQRLL